MGLNELEKMYALHSKFYDLTRWLFVWNRKKAINKLELQKGETILVVGCGTGYGFEYILEKIGETGKLIGIDYSSHMLEKARKKVKKYLWKNVELIQADAAKYTTKNVNAVLYSYSITMIPEWKKSLQNSYKSLKKNGRLVIVDFGKCKIPVIKQVLDWNFKKHGVNNYIFLKKELKKYFKKVSYTEYFKGYNFIVNSIK
ncbi:hypothetical protein COV11_04460 [Candidatus Woesearchaeota archaeon CG10_big_fil_rev_8_21_14_0_10_30_7]|nr:MAG: hypothetical protein COV11_04460 [Candidatus Woesearchaeota archaeon CG10_big_fil_rev_8_21_14_0_10_30_7]